MYSSQGSIIAGVNYWQDPNHVSLGVPSVFYNETQFILSPGSYTLQPGQLAFHPGQNNEISIVRWTAPESTNYTIAASFVGIDDTSTDVHILKNGVSLFQGNIDGLGASSALSPIAISLLAGDTIDFAVGYGKNGNYFFDSTGISAKITSENLNAVPIPTAIWLFVSAITGLLFKRRRMCDVYL